MNRKLTLSIDEKVLESAKQYSGLHKRSISGLVQTFLSRLSTSPTEAMSNTPITQELTGILRLTNDTPEDAYAKHLLNKYS